MIKSRLPYAQTSRTKSIADGRDACRITRDDLLSLRAASAKEAPARQAFSKVLVDLQNALLGLFVSPLKKKNSMCEYYGHIIDKGNWRGYLPRCSDCGCEVQSPDQLRKSMAK